MSVESLIIQKGTTCDIFSRTAGQDTIGGRIDASTPAIREAEPIFLEELSGNEGEVAGREGVRSSHRGFLIFRSDFTPTVNMEFKLPAGAGAGNYTEIFDVTFEENPHRFDHHWEIMLVQRQ